MFPAHRAERILVFVSNPPSSVTPQQLDNVSGVLYTQIGQGSSGVSQLILNQSGAALIGKIGLLSGLSVIDGVLVSTTNGPATRLVVDTYNGANAFGSSFRGRRARGTVDDPAAVLKDDVFLQLVGDGYNGTGFSTAKVSVVLFAAEDWTTGTAGTYIGLRTTPTGSLAVQERVRIDPAGRVGMGTTTPQYALDVNGPINAASGLYVNGLAVQVPTVFSVSIPTGVDSLSVSFPSQYGVPPFLTPSIVGPGNVIYFATALAISGAGYLVRFSDTVIEAGATLTTAIFPAS